MPWEKSYNEEQVLSRAMEAFWARGYEATSISDLVKATGINRGSMYAAFSDKRTLFIRSLTYYDQHYRAEFLRHVRAEHSPRNAIVSAFEQVIAAADNDADRRGCLLVNTALELAPHDTEIDEIVHSSFGEVEGFFRQSIEDGQAAGEIDPSLNAENTGRALFGLFIGLHVLIRPRLDPGVMAAILAQAKGMIGAS